MKSKIKVRWYAVKYPNGFWNIQKSPEAINIEKQDVLSPTAMGKEEAAENAKLCASAPEMRELLDDVYLWLGLYIKTIDHHPQHPLNNLLERYEKLKEEYEF